MTRPLNEDGSVPLKRRVQLVLRIKEGKEIKHEVIRDFKPKWVPTTEKPEHFTAFTSAEETTDFIVGTMTECFKDDLASALKELMAWAEANRK